MEFFIEAKPIIIVLHALAAAVGLGAVVTTDTLFFKFLKDFRISRKEADTLDTISKIIWTAILLLLITGVLLYLSAPLDYLAKSKFITKVIVYVIVVLNGIALNAVISPYLIKLSFNEDAEVLRKNRKFRLLRRISFASGALSMVSWFVIFILGSIRGIPVTTVQALTVYLGLVIIAVSGSQLFAKSLHKNHHAE
jgi:hypothetical protein